MKDFLLNADGDLDLSGADLNIGFSDLQHQEHILIGQKGALKELPDRGVGVENFINDSELDDMVSDARVEFEKDGMRVEKINFNEVTGNLNYEANY